METNKLDQVKEEAKKVGNATVANAGTAWQKITSFFKNLDRAYYVGALAIITTLLFFSAWVDITIISLIGSTLEIPAISGKIAIPQTLFALCSGIDSQLTQISEILNYLDVSNVDGSKITQIYQVIVGIATMLGVNTADWTVNINDIIASIQQMFPDPSQINAIKVILAQISSIAKVGSIAIFLLCAIVVGFNIYTIVVTFKNKKVTKMCKVGFIIELIICAIVIIGCNYLNSLVSSKIFFINEVIVPTFVCWLTIILCIVSIIVVCKITKKAGEKFSKKRAGITIGVIVVVLLAVSVFVGINENNKKQPFIGNWSIANVEKQGILDQEQLNKLQEKGYDFSKSVVITIKQDGTYEESILGHLVQGTYDVVPEGIALFPKNDFNSDFAKIVLKENNGKLTASLGIIDLAEFSKGNEEAKCVSDEIKTAVGMAAIDYVLKFAGIQDMSAEDVVNSFKEIGETLQKLNSVDQNQIARQIKEAIGAELQNAYNKLNDKQKEAINTIYYIIINS